MNKLFSTVLAAAVICALLAAQAGARQNRIDLQKRSIDRGVRNGSISPTERRRLNQRLNHTSESIYRERHN